MKSFKRKATVAEGKVEIPDGKYPASIIGVSVYDSIKTKATQYSEVGDVATQFDFIMGVKVGDKTIIKKNYGTNSKFSSGTLKGGGFTLVKSVFGFDTDGEVEEFLEEKLTIDAEGPVFDYGCFLGLDVTVILETNKETKKQRLSVVSAGKSKDTGAIDLTPTVLEGYFFSTHEKGEGKKLGAQFRKNVDMTLLEDWEAVTENAKNIADLAQSWE